MPRALHAFPASLKQDRKPSHYDRYFDGRVWEIAPGDEPHTNLVSLRYTLMRRAKRKNLQLRTSLRGNGTSGVRLYVQVIAAREPAGVSA